MNRKIFSHKIIKSLAGIIAATAIPGFVIKNRNSGKDIKVNINPDAVRREKMGGRNVRNPK